MKDNRKLWCHKAVGVSGKESPIASSPRKVWNTIFINFPSPSKTGGGIHSCTQERLALEAMTKGLTKLLRIGSWVVNIRGSSYGWTHCVENTSGMNFIYRVQWGNSCEPRGMSELCIVVSTINESFNILQYYKNQLQINVFLIDFIPSWELTISHSRGGISSSFPGLTRWPACMAHQRAAGTSSWWDPCDGAQCSWKARQTQKAVGKRKMQDHV